MGCHIGFYKVLDKPSFDIEELKKKYLQILKEHRTEFKPHRDKRLDPNHPFYYIDKSIENSLPHLTIIHFESWFQDVDDYCGFFMGDGVYDLILPLERNPLLHQFQGKAFQLPCVEDKGGKEGLSKIFPHFIECKELDCPSVRLFPGGATFTTKESILDYLKAEATPKTKRESDECAEFLDKHFVNGKHLIYLR